MPDGPQPLLLRRLRAVHEALRDAGFDHAVGGAIALAVHVLEPRFTADIDLNVMADPEQPDAMLACLPEEIRIPDDASRTIARDGQIRLIWPSPDTPVDLFLPQHPTYHALVTERAEPVDFLGADIKVMTATDLIVFKVLFDRSKDWVDIEALLENGAGDAAEAIGWLTEFLGPDPRVARLSTLAEESRRHVD
ncbi:nucleotidyl transferase AbiEii/AbiGii toxin family protein [Nocardioides sp. BYT-33-1]|uniref:nucleotidyl transferase AbiEii/AbiGii toxin family protein n=1 Tax=Nocardioides sp. BYT-33-1 TaxID=3416952 RepID=UPI003F53394F